MSMQVNCFKCGTSLYLLKSGAANVKDGLGIVFFAGTGSAFQGDRGYLWICDDCYESEMADSIKVTNSNN